jgi:hypothetical protein
LLTERLSSRVGRPIGVDFQHQGGHDGLGDALIFPEQVGIP